MGGSETRKEFIDSGVGGEIHGKEPPSEDVVQAWFLRGSAFPQVAEGRRSRIRSGACDCTEA